MTVKRRLLTILVTAASCATANAQPAPSPQQVRSLAANCAQCHGTDGRPAAGSILPALAGRPQAELTEQLMAYRAGTLPSTVMTQLANGFSEPQLRALAAYFAAQPR